MKARLLFVVLALALMSVPAYSQVAGTWIGENQGRGGTQETTVVLEIDGNTLTGTFGNTSQPAADITDGIVDGDSISFSRSLDFPAGRFGGRSRGFGFRGRREITLNFTGEIEGNELTLNVVSGARIQNLDADGDGRVSSAEWPGQEQMFNTLDANGDGFLSSDDRVPIVLTRQ